MTLATIADPNPGTMDVFLLLAVVLFLVGTVLALIERTVITTLTLAGLAAVAIALMFLN